MLKHNATTPITKRCLLIKMQYVYYKPLYKDLRCPENSWSSNDFIRFEVKTPLVTIDDLYRELEKQDLVPLRRNDYYLQVKINNEWIEESNVLLLPIEEVYVKLVSLQYFKKMKGNGLVVVTKPRPINKLYCCILS